MADNRSREMVQRIQIGLTGLAGVVLLVGLANVVIEKAGVDVTASDGAPPQVTPTIGANMVETPAASEPLAELGVTPPPPPGEDKTPPADAPPQPQVVPDLEPNPALKKPMDQ